MQCRSETNPWERAGPAVAANPWKIWIHWSRQEKERMRVIFQRHPPGGVACREGKTIQAISWTENRQVILFFSSCLRLCCCRYCYSRSLLLTSHFPSDPEDFDHISLGQLLRWRDLIATPHPREHGKQPDVAFFFFFFSLRVPLACCFSWLYFRLSRRLFLCWHLFLSPAERVPPFPAFGIGLDSLIAIVHPRRITAYNTGPVRPATRWVATTATWR
jgi:hypothetical protein